MDNGCSYANEQLSLICVSLGVVLLHTKIRDGASKAKIERSWRTLKERWLYTLDIGQIHSLNQFNELLREYMRQYNLTPHSGIQCAPFERYQATKDVIRLPQSKEWLDECFLNRITRKVRKDATVSIDTLSYDVPMQFISQSVDIRYEPNNMDSAFILFDGHRYPIRRTNKVDNCHTKRNNAGVDYSKFC